MDADKGCARAGNKDSQLVEEGVEGVEGTVGRERCVLEGEEESGSDALVDGIFGDINEQER